MRLIIWTAADSQMIGRTFGVSLKSFRPEVPPHQFVQSVAGGELVKPGPGEVCLVAGKPLEELQAIKLAPKNRTVGFGGW